MKSSSLHLVIAFVVFVVTVTGYVFWYYALSALSVEVGKLTSEVSAKKQDAATAAVAEGELAKLSVEEGAIRGYSVSPSEIVSFLESLQAIGNATGSKVTIVSVSAVQLPRPHLDLALKVTGSFDAVMKTVGAIEYTPRDVVVSTLTLDANAGQDAKGWGAAMTLYVGTASSSSPVKKTP